MKRRPFPIGQSDGLMSDAEFIALVSGQLMPRALDVRDFLDEGDKWGVSWSIETMLGWSEEMFSGLALLWAGQSAEGQERMIARLLPAWCQLRELQELNARRARREANG
jgi:hypothetical protein